MAQWQRLDQHSFPSCRLRSARGFGSKLNSEIGGDLDSAGKSAGSRFGSALKVGALAVIGGAVLAGKFLKGTLEEAREAQVVTARTENVIAKMGNAAGISANQVAKLAGSISAKTGIDDEAIQSGQNLLLTFAHIRNEAGKGNDIFNQTSKLMVDMSAAMGTDAKGSAIQLGKALNDPIKGITALTRVGVSFSEGQKAQIERMVESGNTLGAQKVILAELEKQFGGAAEAMATPADKARTAYANLKEQMGTALLPVVDKVLNAFVAAVPAISAGIAGIGPAFAQVQAFVEPFVTAISGLFSGGPGGGLIAGMVAFAQSIGVQLLPVLQTMSATFTGTVIPAVTALATYLAATLFPVFQQIAGIVRDQVLPIVASLATFFYGTLYPAIIGVVTAVAQNLRPVFEALVSVFQGSVLPAIQQLLVKFREWQPTIQKVIGVIVQIIGKVLEFAAAVLAKVLPTVIRFAGFLISNVVPAVAGVIGVVIKIIAKVIEFGSTVVDAVKFIVEFVKGLKEKFGDALDYIKGLPGKILDGLGSLATTLLESGKDLIRGLIDGVKAMAGDIASAALDVVKDAVDGVKSFLGIKSPSRLFAEIGRYSMEGFVQGIDDHKGRVLDKMQTLRDGLKSVIDQIKSDFASLSSSVASAFTGNAFEATTGAEFVSNLLDTKGQLKALKAAFKKLTGWGVPASFLSQLFASGNGALILDLASGGRSTAFDAFQQFGQVQNLSGQLGNDVASNQYGAKLDRGNELLVDINRNIKHLSKELAHEINNAAGSAARRR